MGDAVGWEAVILLGALRKGQGHPMGCKYLNQCQVKGRGRQRKEVGLPPPPLWHSVAEVGGRGSGEEEIAVWAQWGLLNG